MAFTIAGIRYSKLLLGGGITSGELQTELADAGNLGSLDLLLSYNYYKRLLLSFGSPSYNILDGSEIAKYRYILNTIYIYNLFSTNVVTTMDVKTSAIRTLSAGQLYYGGGVNDLVSEINWMEKLTSLTTKALYKHLYITDTHTAHSSQLGSLQGWAGTFESQDFNYGAWVGGFSSGPTYTTNMSRFNYGTQTSSTVASAVSGNRVYFSFAQNDDNAWSMGGATSNSIVGTTIIDKITKDTNTKSALGVNMSQAWGLNATGNSSLSAYTFGGQSSGAFTDLIAKFVYSTETPSTLAEVLSVDGSSTFASSAPDKMRVGGRYNGSYQSDIDEFTVNTETISVASYTLGLPTISNYVRPAITAGS